ncbi:hypothetical protein [Spirosoma linguale]|uniref:Uncharacterized protein n=1 Tax=Spirosoma linguale (strain ATCC 33905 / DSM 74 / LMG 10896 / Claus 1) TaxID=504472 RepID=D2QGN4_SPILD|nr:hypothetical protein Slin_2524 [Spirosoma linguale DSM 74]
MLIDYAVSIFYGYLLIGAVFGVYFVSLGAARIDPDAHGMPLVLRLLLWPASAALWPVLLRKVLQQKTGSKDTPSTTSQPSQS